MKSVSNEVRKKQVSVLIPETVYASAVEAARSGGQSLAAWLRYAISAYAKNWKQPAAHVNTIGLTCNHPSCRCPASECRLPKQHRRQHQWDKNAE